MIDASGFYLAVVVYYTASNTGQARPRSSRATSCPPTSTARRGSATSWSATRAVASLALQPSLAQDPTNPRDPRRRLEDAARDRDSLAEYEFKIGTYASFDRGRRWFDLGQLNTCPISRAPRSSWPLKNRCYPADDPRRGGTGPEDATDSRGQGDLGEEYTTSDVWTQFDDEGNAYAMVLDAPPYSGDSSGNGFGMSFHRWETPSLQDIRSGRTWSSRVPINAYTTPRAQASTLDDKNTFAVNNAGPDHDGKTGIIVACWGRNFDLIESARQRIVCERSTDGGRSWPGRPRAISPPLTQPLPFGPLVVGVDVVADERDPNTFYAVWLDTLTGFVDGTGTSPLWLARTTNGARSWEPAHIVARISQLPNIFPRQSFRNLSLPIMAAAPSGGLYLTYADYARAPDPATDADGFQADIMITRSNDRGDSGRRRGASTATSTTRTSSSRSSGSRRAARST